MIKYILLLTLTTYLLAEPAHSTVSTYFESKNFNNSVQKDEGTVYGIGADIYLSGSEIKLAYEQGNIKSLGAIEDLKSKKMFFKYAYRFDKNFELNINYISVEDKLVETDGGTVGGGGMTYHFNRKIALNFTQYFSDYVNFDILQSDLKLDYKTRIGKVKVKFSSITKYIYVEDSETKSPFIEYAKQSYTTTGIKIDSKYKSYDLALCTYFGKRIFAIMDDGFKLQHYALEFDRAYAISAGKTISDFTLRFRYIYQRAIELPLQNAKSVDVQSLKFIASYKF